LGMAGDPLLEGLGEGDRELIAALAAALGQAPGALIGAWAREHALALASMSPAITAVVQVREA